MTEFAEFTKVEKDQDPPPSAVDNTADNAPVDDDEFEEGEDANEDEPTDEPEDEPEDEPVPSPDPATGDFFKQLGALTFNNPKAMAEVSQSMGGQQQEQIPVPEFAVTQEAYDEMTEAEKLLYGGLWSMHEKNVRLEKEVRQGQNMTIFQRQSQELKEKFGKDVDVSKVVRYASERQIANLDDAYKAMNWGKPPGKENDMKHRQRNKSMQTVTGSKNRGGGSQNKPLQLTNDQRKVLRGLNESGANISDQRYAQQAQAISRERQAGTYGREGSGKIKNYVAIKD